MSCCPDEWSRNACCVLIFVPQQQNAMGSLHNIDFRCVLGELGLLREGTGFREPGSRSRSGSGAGFDGSRQDPGSGVPKVVPGFEGFGVPGFDGF